MQQYFRLFPTPPKNHYVGNEFWSYKMVLPLVQRFQVPSCCYRQPSTHPRAQRSFYRALKTHTERSSSDDVIGK